MAEEQPRKTLKRLKTGAFERRLSMAKAGFMASSRLAAHSASNLFNSKEKRKQRQKEILAKQTHYLVEEMGKLKGSIVKIGQMMALYGEHFLPPEVTEALHRLESETTALDWPPIYEELKNSLGEAKLAQLIIDEDPIGCASIGQVHRARIKATGEEICLKIQYPGVAEAIDSDLNAVETLIRVARIVPITEEFSNWFDEIREMMYREVDYKHEFEKTALFGERLKDDSRYIVPKVYEAFSNNKVIATSYEPGFDIDSKTTLALSQERRDQLCIAALDLCWREVFDWGEMQTDPNFGNYFVRLGDGHREPDRIVLLDFGAVREFSQTTLVPGRQIVAASFYHDEDWLFAALDEMRFFRVADTPVTAKRGLEKLCYMAIEPFVDIHKFPPPAFLLNEKGEYLWGKSDLPARLSMQAGVSAANRYFTVPPREMMFLARKIMGAYTFLSVLDAAILGQPILEPYVEKLPRPEV